MMSAWNFCVSCWSLTGSSYIFLFPGKLLCLTESSGSIQSCTNSSTALWRNSQSPCPPLAAITAFPVWLKRKTNPESQLENVQHFLNKTQTWLRTHSATYSQILAGRTNISTCYFWQTDRKVTIKNDQWMIKNSLTETRSRLESRETFLYWHARL